MYTIFCAILPVFLIIGIGAVVEKMQILPQNAANALSAFAINIAIPCLTFHIMSTAPLDKMTQWSWWLGILLVQTGLYAALYLFLRLRGKDTGESVIYSLSVAFANVGFVGLPVIINVYNNDNEALTCAGLVMVAANVLAIISQMTLIAWAGKKKSQKEPEKRLPLHSRIWRFLTRYILSNTVLMATLLGIVAAVAGIHVWAPLDKGIAMIGYTAPTCMLFTMGFSLRENIVRAAAAHAISFSQQFWLCLWRLVLAPLATLAVMTALHIDPVWVSATVICQTTGTAIYVSALGQLYNAAPGQAALTVAATNLLSLFSLSGMLMLLHCLGLMPV